MEKESEEILYPIGIVARMFDLSVATLRAYEQEGLIIPQKSKGHHRFYSDHDIQRITCIRKMIDEKGLNLAGIRMILSAIPCWELKPCTLADRESCDAYSCADVPCWMVENKGEICALQDCRQCAVYKESYKCSNIKSILNRFWRKELNGEKTQQT